MFLKPLKSPLQPHRLKLHKKVKWDLKKKIRWKKKFYMSLNSRFQHHKFHKRNRIFKCNRFKLRRNKINNLKFLKKNNKEKVKMKIKNKNNLNKINRSINQEFCMLKNRRIQILKKNQQPNKRLQLNNNNPKILLCPKQKLSRK
jgi:hypothetical protein